MITVTAQFPADIPHEVLAQTLAYIGGRIVDHAPALAQARKVKRAAAKPAVDYQDLPVYRDGDEVRVIDGVTVAKLIAKMDGTRKRLNNSDGRNNGHFPDFDAMVKRCARDPGADVAGDYVRLFCQNMRHVPAQYSNGVTA